MNCRQAREVMNLVFDGELHAQESTAREHIQECAECMQWMAGMERVMKCVTSARQELPVVDFSAAVMSRLPARHPASVPRRKVFISKRALRWMLAGWACSLLVMVVLGAMGVRWLGTPSAGEHVAQSYYVTRIMAESTGTVMTVLRPLWRAANILAVGYRTTALNLLIALVLIETMLVVAGCVVWRKHSRIPHSTSVLI